MCVCVTYEVVSMVWEGAQVPSVLTCTRHVTMTTHYMQSSRFIG